MIKKWEVGGSEFVVRPPLFWDHFGSHFQLKVEKRNPRINAKIDTEKGNGNIAIEARRDSKMRPEWS